MAWFSVTLNLRWSMVTLYFSTVVLPRSLLKSVRIISRLTCMCVRLHEKIISIRHVEFQLRITCQKRGKSGHYSIVENPRLCDHLGQLNQMLERSQIRWQSARASHTKVWCLETELATGTNFTSELQNSELSLSLNLKGLSHQIRSAWK